MDEDQRTEFTSPSGYTVKSARTQPRPRSARKVAWNEDSSENAGSSTCASPVSSMDPVQTLTDEEKWINDYTKEDRINGEKRQKRVTERPRSGQTIWQSHKDEPLSSTDKPSDVRGGHEEDYTEVQELDATELASTECLSVRPGGSENGRKIRPPNSTKNGSSSAETNPPTTTEEEEQPQVSPQQAQKPSKQGVKRREIAMDDAYQKREDDRLKELFERARYPHGRVRMPRGNCLVCGTHGNPLDNPAVQNDKELLELCLEMKRHDEAREAMEALEKKKMAEERDGTGSKAMSHETEQTEGNPLSPADLEEIKGHHDPQEAGTMTESTILQRVVNKVRSLVGGDPRECDGNVETDSKCKEDEDEEKAERSLDTHPSESLTRELSECNISREIDTGSECSDEGELPNREGSVRRRLLGWVNDRMKKRYHDKIARSLQREAQEGQSVYVSGFVGRTSLHLGLSRISTRAEREQEKRANLFKADARRKGMESRWIRWERERRQRKEERLEKDREENSQSQLAWVLQQNEKADKNLDNYNGSQEYVTGNRLLKKEMIGWSRSPE